MNNLDIDLLKNKLCSTFGLCKIPTSAIAYIYAQTIQDLTKSQIKQLAEQHGMSCVEWHKFDVNTDDKTSVLAGRLINGSVVISDKYGEYVIDDFDDIKAFHGNWCELPTPMEGK